MPPTQLLSLLLLAAVAPAQEDTLAANLEKHVGFLADDRLEGRLAGTDGAREAARYLAAALESYGLEPLGDEGTFLQGIPAVHVRHSAPPRLVFTKKNGEEVEGVYGRDFHVALRGEARSTGKLAIRRVGTLKELPQEPGVEEALLLFASTAQRDEWLAIRGQGDAEEWGLDLRPAPSEDHGKEKAAPRPLTLFGEQPADASEIVSVRGELREQLVWKGFTHVQLIFEEVREEVVESNVIGRIAGSRPDEVVLLQAGYDYLGALADGEDARRDVILNGANAASGAAALLELARRFAEEGAGTRSVVFLFTTGTPNERFGVETFLAKPAFDLSQVVAMLAVDDLGHQPEGRRKGMVLLTGYKRSNLGPAWSEAGLRLQPAPAALYRRGANHNFTRLGVPAQVFRCTAPESGLGDRAETAASLDYGHFADVVRTIGDAVESLRDGSLTPAADEKGD